MEIKPVIAKKPPEYPTEYLFINNPELFRRYIPLRWYKNKLVCTALSVFIVAGTTNSCSVAPKTATEINNERENGEKSKEEIVNKQIAKVAPIFSHGKGSGAVGCVVTSPPVFISESEAMEIILEEFNKENIVFDTSNCPKITFQAEAIADMNFDDIKRTETANVSMKIDAINNEHNCVIEYMSHDNFKAFQSGHGGYSTLYEVDTKKAAKLTRSALLKEGKYNAGIFYDPMQIMEFEREEENYAKLELIHIKAKEKAKKMLESQVHD
jgi:hypothetical protein